MYFGAEVPDKVLWKFDVASTSSDGGDTGSWNEQKLDGFADLYQTFGVAQAQRPEGTVGWIFGGYQSPLDAVAQLDTLDWMDWSTVIVGCQRWVVGVGVGVVCALRVFEGDADVTSRAQVLQATDVGKPDACNTWLVLRDPTTPARCKCLRLWTFGNQLKMNMIDSCAAAWTWTRPCPTSEYTLFPA